MHVYKIYYRGIQSDGKVDPLESDWVLLDGFPDGVDTDMIVAVRKTIMTHVGRSLGWKDVVLESVDDRGRALGPPICRD